MKKLLFFFLITGYCYGQEQQFMIEDLQTKKFVDWAKTKKVIMIGENHGTVETPGVLYTIAEGFRRNNIKFSVGLEINMDFQNDIDQYLKAGDKRILESSGFFTNEFKDGRSSIAVADLIQHLRELGNVQIFCFDNHSKIDPGDRDSLMAENIKKRISNGTTLVLTGNLHANLIRGYFKPGFKSAAYFLKNKHGLKDKIITLNSFFKKGNAWNCMSDGCKERPVFTNPDIGRKYGKENFLVISDSVDIFGYNGFFFFINATASLPFRQ